MTRNTAPRLLSAAEAARAINPALNAKTFKRLADRHGIPHYKLGRERFYAPGDIQTLLERSIRCPEEEQAPVSHGDVVVGSSAGRKADAHASAVSARMIAERLKRPSKDFSSNAGSDR